MSISTRPASPPPWPSPSTTGDASGYLKFLTTGGSDYPLEELKIAGIDLTKPDTVRSALRVFDETVDELSALLL